MMEAPAANSSAGGGGDGGDGGGGDDPEHIRRKKEFSVYLALNSPHGIFQKTEANKSTFYEPQS